MHDDAKATDPVCGMEVNVDGARVAGLSAERDGTTYYFCGRGCLLEFRDDPQRFLEPGYVPRM
jgi:Cu+-exporting ATPase